MAKSTAYARSRAKSKAQTQNQATILIVVVVVAIAAAVVSAIIGSQLSRSSSTTATTTGKYAAVAQSTTSDGAPILGDPNAKITILEFADFSCPHCLEYHSTIDQIIDAFVVSGQAKFMFRPMTFVGGQFSETAAQAALCAGKQGNFWDMESALFNLQATRGYTAFDPSTMKATADDLKLNGSSLQACVLNQDTMPTVQSSAQLFSSLGATGTPSMLYSTDGKTFSWWTGTDGKPVIPSFDQIAQTVLHANS